MKRAQPTLIVTGGRRIQRDDLAGSLVLIEAGLKSVIRICERAVEGHRLAGSVATGGKRAEMRSRQFGDRFLRTYLASCL